MNRIIVIGSSGAGKTTLAEDLSAKLDIPHFELDGVFHQKKWQPLETNEFKARVDEITKAPQWIICGNYFTKLGGLHFWTKADTVIWCDYSFPIVFSRLLRRTLKRTITKQELWNENHEGFVVNFFSKDSVLLWMMREWDEMKQRYEKIFKENTLKTTKLVRLKNSKETAQFLEHTRYLRPRL
ncbi:MAG TPA: hypothetical protein VIM31_00225 [Candidatus Microsaccharimonas sp.]|jgi:adenylate kinase family enzyme